MKYQTKILNTVTLVKTLVKKKTTTYGSAAYASSSYTVPQDILLAMIDENISLYIKKKDKWMIVKDKDINKIYQHIELSFDQN